MLPPTPLASQPTLPRFENAIAIASLKRLRDWFIDRSAAPARKKRPALANGRDELSCRRNIDAVDDPAQGEQQLACLQPGPRKS
jgi:hypothetical protein